jgi:hypothetical protein
MNTYLKKEINMIKSNPIASYNFQKTNFLKLYQMLRDTDWTASNDEEAIDYYLI